MIANSALINPSDTPCTSATPLTVSVIYAPAAGKAFYRTLCLPACATVRDAINASNILAHYANTPELGTFAAWLANTPNSATPVHRAWFVGVFSVKKSLGTKLEMGDRIEIYRALAMDPMARRRQK